MRRRVLGLAAMVTLLTVAVGPTEQRPARADNSVPSVAVSATSQITDGQTVTVTVRSTSGVPVYRAEARECRDGVAYQGSTANRPNPDFEANGPNCPGPGNPISTSGDPGAVDTGTLANAPTLDGESFLFKLAAGQTSWTDQAGTPRTLTCDQKHPCAFVVELLFRTASDQAPQWKPFVFRITFGNDDPIAACGGPAADALQTGGSDRISDAWIAWTLGSCARPGAHGAPGRATFVGEGNAVNTFINGALDLAYTAGGYDKDMALAKGELRRPAVAVPIALNAAVLGLAGGFPADSTHKVPYKDVKLTSGEFATMISGGPQGLAQPGPSPTPSSPKTWEDQIRARNPDLGRTGLFDSSAGYHISAWADAEAFSWYATRYFKLLAPGAWVVPDLSSFHEDRGKPRGIDANLALAQPSFADAIPLQSGRPLVRKALSNMGPTTSGGAWLLTDFETSSILGMTPVQIPDAAGNFVMPTPDTLRAAVPSMKANDQGILISDPKATPANAYPMTFVEYALAPTQPLLNDDCTPRPDAQVLLTNWLTYITGDGQAKLPSGMVALPQALRNQAATAIAKVGTEPITGKCAAASGQPPAIAPPGGDQPVVDAPVSAPVGSLPSAPGAGSGSAPSGPLAADYTQPPSLAFAPTGDAPLATPSAADNATPTQHIAAVPPFAGRRSSGWTAPVLGLVGIMALSTLALSTTSKSK